MLKLLLLNVVGRMERLSGASFNLWLVFIGISFLNGNSGSANGVNSIGKITNFTIGAVLSDDRHDTLFREAITVCIPSFS